LHGFASGPESKKGVALTARLTPAGLRLERLDLRVPSLAGLRFSSMLEVTRGAIGGPRDRVVVFGSSLGGLTAARLAEDDARVSALVLLAPAFRFVDRWRTRYPAELRAWEETGFHETHDHATGGTARIDYGFVRDIEVLDARGDGWPDVRVPTLIVHGTRDDVVDIGLSRVWAGGKRHVRLVEVDDDHELLTSLDVIEAEALRLLAPWLGA
jgi:alpha-beta hydrolase superfamily lysophospholipase